MQRHLINKDDFRFYFYCFDNHLNLFFYGIHKNIFKETWSWLIIPIFEN